MSDPMTTTDPKLIEPVAWMYEDENGSVVVYRNRVPLPGFVIETPLYIAAAINEAAQKERAGICRLAAVRATAAEPVAWILTHPTLGIPELHFERQPGEAYIGWTETPLYQESH